MASCLSRGCGKICHGEGHQDIIPCPGRHYSCFYGCCGFRLCAFEPFLLIQTTQGCFSYGHPDLQHLVTLLYAFSSFNKGAGER